MSNRKYFWSNIQIEWPWNNPDTENITVDIPLTDENKELLRGLFRANSIYFDELSPDCSLKYKKWNNQQGLLLTDLHLEITYNGVESIKIANQQIWDETFFITEGYWNFNEISVAYYNLSPLFKFDNGYEVFKGHHWPHGGDYEEITNQNQESIKIKETIGAYSKKYAIPGFQVGGKTIWGAGFTRDQNDKYAVEEGYINKEGTGLSFGSNRITRPKNWQYFEHTKNIIPLGMDNLRAETEVVVKDKILSNKNYKYIYNNYANALIKEEDIANFYIHKINLTLKDDSVKMFFDVTIDNVQEDIQFDDVDRETSYEGLTILHKYVPIYSFWFLFLADNFAIEKVYSYEKTNSFNYYNYNSSWTTVGELEKRELNEWKQYFNPTSKNFEIKNAKYWDPFHLSGCYDGIYHCGSSGTDVRNFPFWCKAKSDLKNSLWVYSHYIYKNNEAFILKPTLRFFTQSILISNQNIQYPAEIPNSFILPSSLKINISDKNDYIDGKASTGWEGEVRTASLIIQQEWVNKNFLGLGGLSNSKYNLNAKRIVFSRWKDSQGPKDQKFYTFLSFNKENPYENLDGILNYFYHLYIGSGTGIARQRATNDKPFSLLSWKTNQWNTGIWNSTGGTLRLEETEKWWNQSNNGAIYLDWRSGYTFFKDNHLAEIENDCGRRVVSSYFGQRILENDVIKEIWSTSLRPIDPLHSGYDYIGRYPLRATGVGELSLYTFNSPAFYDWNSNPYINPWTTPIKRTIQTSFRSSSNNDIRPEILSLELVNLLELNNYNADFDQGFWRPNKRIDDGDDSDFLEKNEDCHFFILTTNPQWVYWELLVSLKNEESSIIKPATIEININEDSVGGYQKVQSGYQNLQGHWVPGSVSDWTPLWRFSPNRKHNNSYNYQSSIFSGVLYVDANGKLFTLRLVPYQLYPNVWETTWEAIPTSVSFTFYPSSYNFSLNNIFNDGTSAFVHWSSVTLSTQQKDVPPYDYIPKITHFILWY